MSLDVSLQLLAQAEAGEVDATAFVETIRTSLPYAYDMVASLAQDLKTGQAEFADNQVPPPSEAERGQLLRALASDTIRGSLERHFGMRLAFQNCHRVAAFPLDAENTETYTKFTSQRTQILNQSPLLPGLLRRFGSLREASAHRSAPVCRDERRARWERTKPVTAFTDGHASHHAAQAKQAITPSLVAAAIRSEASQAMAGAGAPSGR